VFVCCGAYVCTVIFFLCVCVFLCAFLFVCVRECVRARACVVRVRARSCVCAYGLGVFYFCVGGVFRFDQVSAPLSPDLIILDICATSRPSPSTCHPSTSL